MHAARRNHSPFCGRVRGRRRTRALAYVAAALLARVNATNAQDDFDPSPPVRLGCTYIVRDGVGSEEIVIETRAGPDEAAAGTKTFAAARDGTQQARFAVLPGELAECTFPSGTVVRLKVGEDRKYGNCGQIGEVFASVWVDHRKLVSRQWMANHCIEELRDPDISLRTPNPDGPSAGLRLEKCTSPFRDAPEPAVCVPYPDVARYPVDEIEYPPDGAQPPAVGTIEIAGGADAVCEIVRREWVATDAGYRNPDPDSQPPTLESAVPWQPSTLVLPRELRGAHESIFDFDNDGALDRVLKLRSETRYMNGQVLFVQPGSSTVEPPQATGLDESFKLYPCQMGGAASYLECPPFSGKNNEAGFDMPADPMPIHFRGRYSVLTPFRFEGTTYVRAERRSEELADYRAVLRPRPGGELEPMCLLRRVTENF